MISRPMEILYVEDNPGDVLLARKSLQVANVANRLNVVTNGDAAIGFLRKEGEYKDVRRPDLILLDLNLPRKSGREVLSEIKEDPLLRTIPIVVLTTSEAEADVLASYALGANCYVVKPPGLDEFISLVRSIQEFWLEVVKLPGG